MYCWPRIFRVGTVTICPSLTCCLHSLDWRGVSRWQVPHYQVCPPSTYYNSSAHHVLRVSQLSSIHDGPMTSCHSDPPLSLEISEQDCSSGHSFNFCHPSSSCTSRRIDIEMDFLGRIIAVVGKNPDQGHDLDLDQVHLCLEPNLHKRFAELVPGHSSVDFHRRRTLHFSSCLKNGSASCWFLWGISTSWGRMLLHSPDCSH